MLRIYDEPAFLEPPKCVYFDLDNTLYPYEPAHAAAMKAVIEKSARDLELSARQVEQAFTEARQVVKKRLGNTGSSHSRLLYFSYGIELLKFNSHPLLALDLEQRYWQAFLNNITLYDGVRDFLDALRRAGIVLCLVTDLTAQIQFRKILFLELETYFDFIVTSEESGCDKPGQASFLLAQEKTGIDARHTWIIGDSYTAEIEGGKAAGLSTLLFGDAGDFADKPNLAFTSYPRLWEYMKRWLI
jgi:putative hydrolase of the HAD superfamily